MTAPARGRNPGLANSIAGGLKNLMVGRDGIVIGQGCVQLTKRLLTQLSSEIRL